MTNEGDRMPKYDIRKVKATRVVIGDHNTFRDQPETPSEVAAHVRSLDKLAEQVQTSADDIREIQDALGELRAELSGKREPTRIRELLNKLGASANTIATFADGVEKVRQSIGQWT